MFRRDTELQHALEPDLFAPGELLADRRLRNGLHVQAVTLPEAGKTCIVDTASLRFRAQFQQLRSQRSQSS